MRCRRRTQCLSDGEISNIVESIFEMRPYFIEQRLKLRNPIYYESASYGHMGRTPEKKLLSFTSGDGNEIQKEVETFTWEKTDKAAILREAANRG